jgi:tetratricopeptide (TPR) repeat protein
MRRLFERFRKDLEQFIEQRDYGVLILAAPGEQIGYAVVTLKSIEDGGSPDVFLVFPQDFSSPSKFATLVVGRVKASYEAACEELGLPGKPDVLPSFPEASLDERRPAWLRIREALTFARLLVPANLGKRLVCALLPLNIADPVSYRKLVEKLAEPDGRVPWFRGMRIIVREDATVPMLTEEIRKERFVRLLQVDLSMEAMAADTAAELEDPDLPKEERAQSLLQSACHDYSHQRYESALAKYSELLAHSQETGNISMQALVMNGIGDVYSRMKNRDDARAWYERALVPACDSKSPVLMFTVSRNLAHTYYDLGEFTQAEVFFDGAQELGMQTGDPEAKILALEWRGLSQEEQKKYKEASHSFKDAAKLAREFKREEHFNRNLGNLDRAVSRTGQAGLRASIERDLGGY